MGLTFDQWWEANYADVRSEFPDRTFGEEVWREAQKEADQPAVRDAPEVE